MKRVEQSLVVDDLKKIAESSANPRQVMPKVTTELLHRFFIGDHISDEELDALIDWYGDLLGKLELLGEKYHFAWRDARSYWDILQGFKRLREHN